MPKLEFYDLKTKLRFTTDKYTIKKTKKGQLMAVAISPSGVKAARFVAKDFKK